MRERWYLTIETTLDEEDWDFNECKDNHERLKQLWAADIKTLLENADWTLVYDDGPEEDIYCYPDHMGPDA